MTTTQTAERIIYNLEYAATVADDGRPQLPTDYRRQAVDMLRSQAAEIEMLHLINVNHIEQRRKYVLEIERLILERDTYQKAADDMAAEHKLERDELYKEIRDLQNQYQPQNNY